MKKFIAVSKFNTTTNSWEDVSAKNKDLGRAIWVNKDAVVSIEDVIVNLSKHMTYIHLNNGLAYLVRESVDQVKGLLSDS